MRVITLNFNGIRSAFNKGFLAWFGAQEADVLCVQELKAQASDMTPAMLAPYGYHGYFHYAEKKGYSGVGIYSKKKPDNVVVGLGIPEFDAEGRYIEAQFGKLSVISLYMPSGSSGDERQAVKFKFLEAFLPHMVELKQSGREVIVCGDWNIAHTPKDLKNWKGNQKNSGFLPEERAWLTRVIDEVGFVDVFRKLHPELEAYTWWSNRGQAWAKDVGWRLDYQLTTPAVAEKAVSTGIYREQRFSDHAPMMVDYELS